MTDIERLIDICFSEFCNIAGDSPCGCDACPYGNFGADDDKCYEEFKKHKLNKLGSLSGTWIPVTERLPENGKVVLVCGERGGIYTAWCNSLYKNPGWHKLNSKTHYCNPTHWMPLPESPKEEDDA